MKRFLLRILMVALALGLPACAVEETTRPVAPADAGGLLTPWLTVTGGWRADAQRAPLAPPPPGGPRINFVSPTGVAAMGDVVIVADAGARTLWRLDRQRDSVAAFAAFTGGSPESGASLVLGPDLALWVALPAEHRVVQYDLRGRLVRQWADELAAPRPVAVALPADRSGVWVGDAAAPQVVVFGPLGGVPRAPGRGQPMALQSIAAMAWGPQGLYVLDRLAQQVVVLGSEGEVREVIGENQLVQPRALAVDASGRVFVSDDVDQRIKVFRGARLLGSAGGMGAGPGRFGRIEAMAVDGNLLYVADSLNARVQVMLVAPPSMESPEPPR